MKRTSPLKADPATTAAFHQRGRANGLTRGGKPLHRGKPLRAGTSKPRLVTPPDVWAEVLLRDEGLCVWSRHLGIERRADHGHHLLAKAIWPQFVAVRANICGLAADLHWQHEFSPNDRLPWAALPDECQAFLRDVATEDARAARFVWTKYPGAELET